MREKQRTIKTDISLSGTGLHTGNHCTMTFRPAPPDTGIIFVRADLPDQPQVIADIDHVVDISRGTTLQAGDATVHTVEHVLAAIAGLQIDNLSVELVAGCDASPSWLSKVSRRYLCKTVLFETVRNNGKE